MTSPVFAPAIGIVLLTAAVWTVAVVQRVGEIRRRRIAVQSLARAHDTAATLQDARAMDNYNNLMQAPLLFLVLCFALAQAGVASPPFVAAAWAYLLLRAAHSAIQLTYNRVLHRFAAWAASSVLLFGMWAAFAGVLISST